ncbi:MAG: GNAT family N-acetyltransferase [Ktedonobacteraceae bacterium]
MIIFETERLLFRPLMLSDLDALATLYADPDVTRFLGGPRDRAEVQRALTGYMREYEVYGHSFFATIRKEDETFIGQCGLLNQEVEGRGEIELAYVLARPYWQQGLALEGTRAIRDFGMQKKGFLRLISLIPPANEASIHIAEDIGMKFERSVSQWGQNFSLYAINKAAQ